MKIFILKQCKNCSLEVTLGAVPKSTKKKPRSAKKAAGKVLREEGLGRRFPSGNAEREAGPFDQVITSRDVTTSIRAPGFER